VFRANAVLNYAFLPMLPCCRPALGSVFTWESLCGNQSGFAQGTTGTSDGQIWVSIIPTTRGSPGPCLEEICGASADPVWRN
jgi:hypothetical protein